MTKITFNERLGKYETSMKEISEQPVKVNNTSLVKKRVSYILHCFALFLGFSRWVLHTT